jgi:CheY-like chemotaxis protein
LSSTISLKCELVQAGFEDQPVFAVECAHDAQGALAIPARKPIDLALIDLLMRGHSGLAVAAGVLSRRAAAERLPASAIATAKRS